MTDNPVNWYEYVKAVRKAFDEYDAALAKVEKATEQTMAAFAEIKEWTAAIHLSMLAEASIDRINAATRYHSLPSENLETWVSNTWAARTHKDDPSVLPPELVSTAFVDYYHEHANFDVVGPDREGRPLYAVHVDPDTGKQTVLDVEYEKPITFGVKFRPDATP